MAEASSVRATPWLGFRIFDPARARRRLRAACWVLAPLAAALVPITTTGGEIACIALVACWFLGGVRENGLGTLVRHPVGIAAMLLFGWMAATVLWSPESTDDSLRMLLKYRPLLFVPILLSLFEDERLRRLTTWAFVGTMLVTLGMSFPVWLEWIEPTRWAAASNGAVFKNHITQNVMMAFAAFLLAHSAATDRRWRWTKVALAAVATFNVLAMVEGRTGWVIVAVLAPYLCWSRWGWVGLVRGLTGVALGASVLFTTVPAFHDRVQLGIDQFFDYLAGGTVIGSNSIGLRMQFLQTSLAVAGEQPLVGHGVGSFETVYAAEATARGVYETANPHNEYLMLFVQSGAVGVLLLLSLFAMAWFHAGRLAEDRRSVACALVLVLAVGCLFNSLLLDATESHMFALFAAATCAGLPSRDSVEP